MYSATMLAFHAPPMAVIQPVSRLGKMAGKMSCCQRCGHENCDSRDTSQSSRGIALLPAMTLKRIYHCVPNSSSTTELIPKPVPNASIRSEERRVGKEG